MRAGPLFRAFLFDLDGTLIDHFVGIHRCFAHTLAELGLPPPTPAQVRAVVGGGFEKSLARFVPADRMEEGLRIYRAFSERTLLDDVALMPGARELLAALHECGTPLGVLTNKLGPASRRICGHLGLTPFLRVIAGATDTPWLKPQPEFTAYALTEMKVPALGAVLVGDSPFDVAAAHQGGIAAWCVTTGTHSAEQLCAAQVDAVFPNLAALQSALEL